MNGSINEKKLKHFHKNDIAKDKAYFFFLSI